MAWRKGITPIGRLSRGSSLTCAVLAETARPRPAGRLARGQEKRSTQNLSGIFVWNWAPWSWGKGAVLGGSAAESGDDSHERAPGKV